MVLIRKAQEKFHRSLYEKLYLIQETKGNPNSISIENFECAMNTPFLNECTYSNSFLEMTKAKLF